MTKLLNGDHPEFEEISPMITTHRYDLDQKIKRLAEALGTLGVAATELEKVRIALDGTSPAALISTTAHDTSIPIPAQAVIVAKKLEILRALEASENAFNAVCESVQGVLGSASLPDDQAAGVSGAAHIRLTQLFRHKNQFATGPSASARSARRIDVTATLRPALARWLPN